MTLIFRYQKKLADSDLSKAGSISWPSVLLILHIKQPAWAFRVNVSHSKNGILHLRTTFY